MCYRLARDIQDVEKIMKRMHNMSPFTGIQPLMNIVNGTVAHEASNVDDFYAIGESVIRGMRGKRVFEYQFKRKDAAKTMSVKIKIGKNNEIEIDPGLLFQRLLVLSHATTITNSEVFKHELCSYPPAIFETSTLLRKADKPQIVESITRYVEDKVEQQPVDAAEHEISTEMASVIASPETASEDDPILTLPQEEMVENNTNATSKLP